MLAVTDLAQKWIVGVLLLLTGAIGTAAVKLLADVAELKQWRTETLPLSQAIEHNQMRASISANDVRSAHNEMMLLELERAVNALDDRIRELERRN